MMKSYRRTCGAVLAAAALLAGGAFAGDGTPLVTINGDTLTTDELKMELGVMMSQAPKGVPFATPEPERVLRRMIQNELVIQEGYRMGLDEQFTVRNPRSEAVRNRCVRTLLDSVASTVPQGDLEKEAWVEQRRAAVEDYLAGLRRTYGVEVDTTLLHALDYASTDPDMQKRLRDSDEVIALLPNGDITVAELSREIRFVAFHGLEGKPDAAERRDRIFWQNLNERLVAWQAAQEGLHLRPDMVDFAAQVERSLMLEESLGILVQFDFAPTEDEVRAFYEAHLDELTPAARIRMESVKLRSEQEAADLRARALQGAKLSWLAGNMPGVIDGPPPFPEDFFAPQQLGLDPEEAELGLIPEPYGVPGGWVVARIVEIEDTPPPPLDEVRDRIQRMMKAEAIREHMIVVLDRLEEVSTITILPGAEDEVARVTELVVAAREADLAGPETGPGAPAAADGPATTEN